MNIVKKAVFVLIAIACLTSFSYADMIYLKDGKTVEGKIVEKTEILSGPTGCPGRAGWQYFWQ